jgi:DnaA family protein
LPVALGPEAELAAYLPGPNGAALAAVTAWAAGTGDPFLYLFGPPGTGKTHLLQGACRAAAARGAQALFLSLGHPGMEPSVLEDLEVAELIALDDVHAIADDSAWERELFSLYNRLREAGRRLLVSADAPTAGLSIALPDLRSRLGWGPAYRLRPLDESACALLLRQAAAQRGLVLADDSVDYVLRRCPREPRGLLEVLAELDRASLARKRRPSLALVREVVNARRQRA